MYLTSLVKLSGTNLYAHSHGTFSNMRNFVGPSKYHNYNNIPLYLKA